MTTLISGASGFLGSHVAEQLAAEGRKVRALVRRTSDTRFLKELGVELYEANVEDPAALDRAFDGVDRVLHSAGLVKARSEDEFLRVNAEGTRHLLDAAVRAGGVRRFVLVSSLAAVGPSADGKPVEEEHASGPVTAYGRSKRRAEEVTLSRKAELPVTIVRPAAIYGPRDREILAFFKSIKIGVLPLLSAPTTRISMIYGPDCAAACRAALDADLPSGRALFVDDGAAHSMEDLVLAAEAALGRRARLRFRLPERVVRAAAFGSELVGMLRREAVMFNRDKCNELLAEWVCDSSATRDLLGWQPRVSFAEGIRRTVDWYREAGWL